MYDHTDLLAELIAHKHRVLSALRDLGRRQAELIACSQLDLLLKLLSSKQRLLDELLSIDGRLAQFRNEDPETRRWRSRTDRTRCSELAVACERLLCQIVQQEQSSEQAMIKRRDDTAARIDDSHAAARVHGAYFSANQIAAASLDISSGT